VVAKYSKDNAHAIIKGSLKGIMKPKMEQLVNDPNPVLSVVKDGMVIYSNEAGEPLLHEWDVRVGEKLPSCIVDLLQRVISRNSPEKIEVKVGNKVYLVVLSPLPEQECVNISGFDISNQKNLEERIHESEEKYRAVFENSIDAILLTTPDGTIQEANPAACQMFMMREEEIIRAGRSGIVDTSDPRLMSFLEKRARIGKLSGEINHRRKDGTIFPGEVSSAFFKDKNGIIRTATIIRDISEHRQAEHQLSSELARATGLYELYTRSSNLSDCELYDFALNQAVKITDSTIGFFHLVSEDEKEIILTTWNQEALRSCTAGNEGHYPIEKAGNWVDCVRLKRPVVYNDFPSSPNQKGLPVGHATVKRFMSVPVTENGKVRIIFGVGNKMDEYDDCDVMQLQLVANELHKIMKLRRIENEVRESEEKFRQMAENIGEVFFIFTPDWKQTVYVSPAYERIWGRPLKDVYDNSMAWLEGVHPDDRKLPLAVVNKHVGGNIMGTDTVEYRILRPNGTLRWIFARTYPVLDEQGDVCRITGIAEDITHRKLVEEALRKAYDELEEKVKERTEELKEAYNSLKESEKSLADAQEMAHIGNWEWDIITNKAYWSEEMYRIFKRDPQKLAPSLKEYLSYIHPNDLDYYCNTTIATINTINTRKVGTSEVDFRIVLANGEERTLHLKSEYVFNDENIPVRVKGIVQDITERKKVEDELEKIEIARKQEIHHRIKNNLQVISSLLDLQAEKFRGKKNIADSQVLEAFRESQDRVISMALIHEELHKGGELDKLNFSNYIEELAENLFLTYRVGNDNINLIIDLDCNVFLDMDTAVPLGIIINELVSNSLKYAFPDKNGGEIQIKLHRQENGECKSDDCNPAYVLTVSDNGIGIPEDLDIENLDSLGLQLVTTLVDQLDGELEMKRNNGTEFIIRFTVSEKNNQASAPAPQSIE
jgi:PAS domain S-box-containing protein